MNSKTVKILSVLTACSLLFGLTACSGTTQTVKTDSASSQAPEATELTSSSNEITGSVTEIGDNSITVETNDGNMQVITVNDTTAYSFTMGEAPSGDMMPGDGSQPSQGNGDTPPEKPSGDMNQQGSSDDAPQAPQGDGNTPPDMPSGNAPQGDGNTPPEMPSGNGTQDGGNTPPEMPSGDMNQQNPSGDAPQAPHDGENSPMEPEASFEDITIGSTITAVIGTDGTASEIKITMDMGGGNGPMGHGGPGMGSNNVNVSYTAVNTYDSDTTLSGQTVDSTGKDENAVLVTDGTTTVDGCEIIRNSQDSTGGDNSSFYGVGAALLTTGGTLNISNSNITSDSDGGAGVFSYGDGTAYVSDSVISTTRDTSGGIHVAGGGKLYAWNLDVTTMGNSSAAIRSDRGSGTMVIDGGTYTSNGTGSPAVYSTADISINGATLTANSSESVCIEGNNTLRLYNCELAGNMSDDEQNDCTWNVILYQSMSGDSEEGNSLFEMVGGKLISNNGGLFYTTNTQSTFLLKNVEITSTDKSDFLLRCTGNSDVRGWGNSGSNGSDCTFTALEQDLAGDVVWDSISNLDFYLADGSILTGAFLQDESSAGNGGNGYAHLVISEGSKWIVTDDSILTSLECSGSIVDEYGETVSIIGTDGTVYVQGTSDITITVSSYTDSADLSGASVADSFADYSVDKL